MSVIHVFKEISFGAETYFMFFRTDDGYRLIADKVLTEVEWASLLSAD